MRFLTCFILSVFTVGYIYSQQSAIDSLSVLFHKTEQDTTKARLLAEVGVAAYRTNFNLAKSLNDSLISFSKNRSQRYYAQGLRMKGTYAMLQGDYDTALEDYDKAMNIVKKLGRKDIEADYLSNYATLYSYQGIIDSSEIYYLKSIEMNKELGRDVSNITSYINLAINARGKNNIISTTNYLIEALSLSENSSEQYRLEYIHNELAKNYMLLLQYDKAESHLNKALDVATKNNDVGALADIYNSYGYLNETRYDSPSKALVNYEKSLSYRLKGGSKGDIVNAYYNVGLQNIKLNNLNIAEIQTIEGLKRAETTEDQAKEIIGYLQLAHIYILQKKNNEVKQLLNKADKNLHNRSAIVSRQQFFRIGKSYEQVGNFKEATKYIERYAVLSDSLYQKNSLEKIAEIEERYESEKSKNKILRLENQNVFQQLTNQKQQSLLRYLVLGIITLVLAFSIFLYYYRKNKKQKEIIENLQKELHHRVKNNLAVIDTYISITKKDISHPQVKQKLSELQSRIESINTIHEQLYQADDITKLKLKTYINNLAQNIQESFSDNNIKVIQNVDENLQINSDKSFSLGIIINEFLINSFKHAFIDYDNALVVINAISKNGNYEISLSDNGIGLPSSLNLSDLDSFGIDIMKIASKKLKGNFDLQSKEGVKLSIIFPQ